MIHRKIGKTGIVVCTMCKLPCEKEVFFSGHRFVGEKEDALSEFCSVGCRDDYEGVAERIEEEVDKKVREEFNLLHKSVCPSCVRRLLKLI